MKYKISFFLSCAFFLLMLSSSCKRDNTKDLVFTPTIEDVYPQFVNNGDEVKVTFKGISVDKATQKILVKTDDFEVKGELTGYSNIIKFRVPTNLFKTDKIASLNLRINIDGWLSENGPLLKSTLYPRLDKFTPEVVRSGDVVTIYGYNFNPDIAKDNVTLLRKSDNLAFDANIVYADTEVVKVKIPTMPNGEAYFVVMVRTNDPSQPLAVLSFDNTIRILKQ